MFGAMLVGIIILGFVLGKLTHKYVHGCSHKKFTKVISVCQNISIFMLLSMMGYKIGSNRELISNFSTIGFHSALFGIATLLGSALITWLLISLAKKVHLKKKKPKLNSHVPFSVEDEHGSQVHSIVMIVLFLLVVILGGILGYFQAFSINDNVLTNIVDYSLYALIFFIGMDMGLSQLNLEHLKSIGKSAVLICIGVILGSLGGAVIMGTLLGYNVLYSLAIGSPMGWYSLAGIMYSKISAELGAMAFTANLVRELTAIAFVPLIGAFMCKESAIATCGATAMDTTLPAITKGLGKQYAVTGFACGIIISFLVPFLLSIIQIIYGII